MTRNLAALEYQRRHQAKSLATAVLKSRRWTQPELLFLFSHPELTARECAEILGRTFYAVQKCRTEGRERYPYQWVLAGRD